MRGKKVPIIQLGKNAIDGITFVEFNEINENYEKTDMTAFSA